MSDPNTGAPLDLIYLDSGQAQPEVKINDAWNKLNAFASGISPSSDSSDSGGGSISVSDGTNTVDPCTSLVFTNAVVTDEGGGVAHVHGDGGGGGSGGSSAIGAAIYLAASTLAVGSGTHTAFGDTLDFDTGGFWSGSHPTRFTVPDDGLYLVSASAVWDSVGGADRQVTFCINGDITTQFGIGIVPGGTTGYNPSPTNTTLLNLHAGDYVEAFAAQNSGGSVNVLGISKLTRFSIVGF